MRTRRTITRSLAQSLAALFGALILMLAVPRPGQAHWADLAVAEIDVRDATARITLVFPTGLVAEADDNHDGRLSAEEVRAHTAELSTVLGEQIRLTDGPRAGRLAVEPTGNIPSNLKTAPGTHTTLLLTYTWPAPIQQLTIHYGLFLPGVSTATCLATFIQGGRLLTFVFTPVNREFSFTIGSTWSRAWRLLSERAALFAGPVALAGALAGGLAYLLSASRRARMGRRHAMEVQT